jgi:hypothetical protein
MSDKTPTPAPAPKPPKKPGRWSQFLDGLGTAIGEALFGGNR